MRKHTNITNLTNVTITTGLLLIAASPQAASSQCDPTLITEIDSINGKIDSRFGYEIDMNDSVVLVHQQQNTTSNSGTVYVLDPATGNVLSAMKSSAENAGDVFGEAIDIDGSIALIGARNDVMPNGLRSGTAYLFDISDPENPVELARILSPLNLNNIYFGSKVALSGDRAIISAPAITWNYRYEGSAWLFDISDPSNPVLMSHLTAPDAKDNLGFGRALAINDSAVLISAVDAPNGAVYEFDPTDGSFVSKWTRTNPQFDAFGAAIEISGNQAVIAANGTDSAAGALFVWDMDSRTETMKISANPPQGGAQLGSSEGRGLMVYGNLILAGAPTEDVFNNVNSGAAYLFDLQTGEQLARFTPDVRQDKAEYGFAVAVNGSHLMVGEPFSGALNSVGSAYLYGHDCGGPSDCLTLAVDNLVAGARATVTITNGTPGAKGVTVYGLQAGQTIVNNVAGYCATFAIKGVNQSRVIGGINHVFDSNGEITFDLNIPGGTSGVNLFFQSAMRDTCPDECVSNLLDEIVQ